MGDRPPLTYSPTHSNVLNCAAMAYHGSGHPTRVDSCRPPGTESETGAEKTGAEPPQQKAVPLLATTPIPTDINTAESGGRRRLPFSGRLVMAFTFFSMFFGAGNLIFPPFVGAQAALPPFPPSSGSSSRRRPSDSRVLAVTFAGGFDELARRVSPAFARCSA